MSCYNVGGVRFELSLPFFLLGATKERTPERVVNTLPFEEGVRYPLEQRALNGIGAWTVIYGMSATMLSRSFCSSVDQYEKVK